MDLRKFSDEQLLESTRQLVGAERRLVTSLLHHLNEIAVRRLYAKESYPSLFDYCTKVLYFTQAQAHYRICSARLLKEFPEIESKISSGELSLTNLAKIYTHLKTKPLPRIETEKLLTFAEAKSTREVDKLIASLAPRTSRETIRAISDSRTEIRFSVDTETFAKLERLRQVLKLDSLEKVVSKIVDIALIKFDPLKKAERNLGVRNQRNAPISPKGTARYIPAQVRHAVWLRDQGVCTYPGCNSRYGLELDHIILFSHGGPHTPENLRLRCRAHNQLHAQEKLGENKMKQYLS